MSVSVDFATLIGTALKADAAVAAIVGDRVIDGRPAGKLPAPCITLGPSDVVEDDHDCIPGRVEVLQVDCWAADGGKLWPARQLADAVRAALHEAELVLDGSAALVACRVVQHRVFLDADGLHAHGVVQVEGLIEEPAF